MISDTIVEEKTNIEGTENLKKKFRKIPKNVLTDTVVSPVVGFAPRSRGDDSFVFLFAAVIGFVFEFHLNNYEKIKIKWRIQY